MLQREAAGLTGGNGVQRAGSQRSVKVKAPMAARGRRSGADAPFVETLKNGGVTQNAVELLLKVTPRETTALSSSLLPVVVNGLGEFLAVAEASPGLTRAFSFLSLVDPLPYVVY